MKIPPPHDYVEILNLYSNYNLCSDEADAAGYAKCFSTDGVLDIPAVGLKVSGRDKLIEYKMKDKAARRQNYRRHWNNNVHLELLEDGTVKGRCYLLALNGMPTELPVIADCGTYEDTVANEDGQWKFKHRRLTLEATTFRAPVTSPEVAQG